LEDENTEDRGGRQFRRPWLGRERRPDDRREAKAREEARLRQRFRQKKNLNPEVGLTPETQTN
jgi:hypothetical protein